MLSLKSLSSFSFVSSLEIGAALFFAYYAGWIIYARYFHPYAGVPGPFFASFSNLWYHYGIRNGIGERSQGPLHAKYGPIVRIAPNDVSISDPAAIDIIYGTKIIFQKSEFYAPFAPNISKCPDLFTDTDEKHHAARRRAVAHLYTQSAVLEYEPRIALLIEIFCARMDEFMKASTTIDISIWFRKYTFDVIGEMFYGKDGGFGFMRDDIDYNGWMQTLDGMVPVVSSLGYLPKGLQTLYVLQSLIKPKTRAAVKGVPKVINDAHTAVKERLADIESGGGTTRRHDFLSKLIDLTQEKDKKYDFQIADVTTEVWATIWAGSDTTAFSITAIFYYILKDPKCLAKLLEEIDSAFDAGTLTTPIRFSDAIKLPYLHACVMEGMRLHPAVGTMLPRYTPPQGTTLCGRFIPGGCRVGINPIVVQRDKGVFGEDAEDFVPERWLRNGEKAAAHMERHMLHFGVGTRICIGKHITMIEMYKLLPTIFRDYTFELQVKEWRVARAWFHKPDHVLVKMTRRQR